MRRLVIVALVVQVAHLVAGIRWMALHRATPGLWNTSSGLVNSPQPQGVWRRALKERFGLTRRQERVCRDSPELLPLLSKAALSALAASGALFDCPCADTPRDPPNGNFKWGGCGDNVAFGSAVSRRFVDVLERRGQRQAGPHEDDEAFNALPPPPPLQMSRSFRLVQHQDVLEGFASRPVRLKRRYATATEVALRRRGVAGRRHLQPALQLAAALPLQPAGRGVALLHFGREDLLYATKSPDYCSPDPKFGSIGTKGSAAVKRGVAGSVCATAGANHPTRSI
ncbi:hypothetical protein B566_EDAN014302 [Ephemera danica]|nr:hypothetical protein B566_EDAN014302 [Ephemera danica]